MLQAWSRPLLFRVVGLMAAQGTDTGFKNELLFKDFGINYNQLSEQFKKVGVLHGRCMCTINRAAVMHVHI